MAGVRRKSISNTPGYPWPRSTQRSPITMTTRPSSTARLRASRTKCAVCEKGRASRASSFASKPPGFLREHRPIYGRFDDVELLDRAAAHGRALFSRDADLLAEAVRRQRAGRTF